MRTIDYEKELLREAKKEGILALASDKPQEKRRHKKESVKLRELVRRLFHMTGKIETADKNYERGAYYD